MNNIHQKENFVKEKIQQGIEKGVLRDDTSKEADFSIPCYHTLKEAENDLLKASLIVLGGKQRLIRKICFLLGEISRGKGRDVGDGGVVGDYKDFIKSLEPFSWYCTFTFTSDIHPEQANKCFYKWMRKMNERILGRRYRDRKGLQGIAWVRALERQKRGVIHFHCLLEHPSLDRVSYVDAYKIWWTCAKKTGKFNHFERYDPLRGACGYLAKYISKEGELDFSYKNTWIRHRAETNRVTESYNS